MYKDTASTKTKNTVTLFVLWGIPSLYVNRIHLRNIPHHSGSRHFILPWASSNMSCNEIGKALSVLLPLVCLLPSRLCCLHFLIQWSCLLDQNELSRLHPELLKFLLVLSGVGRETSLISPDVELPESGRLYLVELLAIGIALLGLFLKIS